MESRNLHEQETRDHERIVSAGSSSQLQRASPCPNHFQDSTTARAVLATTLEIITTSGNDLNQAYLDPKPCPMLKCFHTSATPMQQIHHIIACPEASKGEIRCWTCQKCHDFKRWHAVCSTLKSPVELLRRLSNKKRGSISSAGEPFATKRGKITASDDDFTLPSQRQRHGVESVWRGMEEMEDHSSSSLAGAASTRGPAQLHADEVNNVHMASELGDSSAIRGLPTPPSTRNHSWSEDSQNMVAYGDAKVARVPEQPPPYIVSPQTTVDDYQNHDNPTDSLRLGIPPVQYIHESNFMESPEDLEIPKADQAPWADHAVLREAEHPQVHLGLARTALDATVSPRPSEKSASIFSSSFAASRIPDPCRLKQNPWPPQPHCSDGIPRPSFGRQQHHIFDGTSGLTEQDGPAAAASQQDTGAEPSVTRQASFDAGARDSTTVGTSDRGPRADSRAPPGDGHQAPAQQEHAVQDHRDRRFEECGRCGQRFRGIAKNRRQHLKRHVASKHGGARFRCGHPECGCSYNRVDNLHDHERKTHGFVLPLQGGGGGGGGARPGPSAGAQAVSYSGGGGGGSEVVAELAAGDVELRGTGGLSRAVAPGAAPEAEGSAPETGQTSGMVETHLAVFDYPISTEEGLGWRPGGDHGFLDARRTTCISEEEWDEIIAGVSGGHEEESGVADAGHETDNSEDGLSMGLGLAPRPLHLPCASWRV